MKELIEENPKATVTVFAGVVIYFLKNNFENVFPPEIFSYFEIIITTLLVFLIGRFTRINKTDVKILNAMVKNKAKEIE